MLATFLVPLLSITNSVLAAQTSTIKGSLVDISITNETVIPKRFIIEVAKGSSLAALRAEIDALQGTTITKVYDSPIFLGISVDSIDGNVDTLQSVTAAATVWPSKMVKLDAATPAQLFVDEAASPNYSVHGMTGVDKLHAAGIYGKGAQVAMIDTGVEYTHPALGGCLGAGCKVAGGYDLVGNGCWPLMGCSKVPNSDPVDLFGIGTFMAGVIIGTNSTNNFVGVAPEASLYSYKVFTSQGITDEDTIIEALIMAYDDGADVISANIVGLAGFADDPLAVVASRLVDQGVVVTIAAGDYGAAGPFFANAGASGDKVLAVTAVQANLDAEPVFQATFTLNGKSSTATIGELYLFNPMPTTRNGWPIIPLTMSTNATNDACETLPDGHPDFTQALALVRLGGCEARVKQSNLIAAGAQNIIFYWDPATSGTNPSVSRLSSFVITISDLAGAAIVNTWLAGGNVTANFSLDTISSADYWVGMPDANSGKPLVDNSWGPLYDLTIKPDIAAPGGSIFSCYPYPYAWAKSSGTKPASAYVAGVAALYIGKYGGRKTNPSFNATDLTMRIISSGSSVPSVNLNTWELTGYSASVAQVGSGLVNASKVLDYTTQLSYAKFSLNDTHNFERYQKVDITNNAQVDVTYSFGILPAAGHETWSSEGRVLLGTELTDMELNPTVTLPSSTFKIKAGNTKTAQINFNYPGSTGTLPIYSGLIQINSSLGESLSVPYLGLDAKLGDFFETNLVSAGYPYVISGLHDVDSTVDSTWSFNLAVNSQDFPKLYFRAAFGCDELRWDIFESTWIEHDWTYPPVVGVKHYVGSATYWPYSSSALVYDPADSQTAGNNTAFPVTATQRFSDDMADSEYWWLGPLANGTKIAPGKYIMRVAALLPFADRSKSNGWSTWTRSFTVAQ